MQGRAYSFRLWTTAAPTLAAEVDVEMQTRGDGGDVGG